MKLRQLFEIQKGKQLSAAIDIRDLFGSLKDGRFTKDGSHLSISDGKPFKEIGLKSLVNGPHFALGDINCSFNDLENLIGAPIFKNPRISSFNCTSNSLTSLEGAPKVCFNFVCDDNENLKSFEFMPEIITGDLSLNGCGFTSLKDIHKHVKEIKNGILLDGCPIKSHVLGLLKIKKLKRAYLNSRDVETIINKYLPEGDIFACQQELIDNGFEEYAKL